MSESSVDDSTVLPPGIEQRWASVRGDDIPYLFAGDSEDAVVLVHGASASRLEWVEFMGTLAASYRLYAPDLTGFGDAPRRHLQHTAEYLAEFLAEFLSIAGVGRAVLAGHSVGARICLEVARRYPGRVTGLVLIAPLGFGSLSLIGRVLSTAPWILSRVFGQRLPYPELLLELDEDASVFRQIQAPALVIWGSKDIYFPVSHGKRAMAAIPNSELRVYDGHGHAPHRGDRERFVRDVIGFLDAGRQGSSTGGCAQEGNSVSS